MIILFSGDVPTKGGGIVPLLRKGIDLSMIPVHTTDPTYQAQEQEGRIFLSQKDFSSKMRDGRFAWHGTADLIQYGLTKGNLGIAAFDPMVHWIVLLPREGVKPVRDLIRARPIPTITCTIYFYAPDEALHTSEDPETYFVVPNESLADQAGIVAGIIRRLLSTR